MVNPGFELTGEGGGGKEEEGRGRGVVLLALVAFLSSLSSLFTQNKGGGAPRPHPYIVDPLL